jgi:hypothetical protein
MRTIFFHYALESMRQLLEALFYDLKQSAPIFADDSSSSCMTHLTCQLATSTITHREGIGALKSSKTPPLDIVSRSV